MANHMQVTLEIGPRGKKVVAVAPDWPGLERGAKTEEAAIERLLSYVPRYAAMTKLAGIKAAFGDQIFIFHFPSVIERNIPPLVILYSTHIVRLFLHMVAICFKDLGFYKKSSIPYVQDCLTPVVS